MHKGLDGGGVGPDTVTTTSTGDLVNHVERLDGRRRRRVLVTGLSVRKHVLVPSRQIVVG